MNLLEHELDRLRESGMREPTLASPLLEHPLPFTKNPHTHLGFKQQVRPSSWTRFSVWVSVLCLDWEHLSDTLPLDSAVLYISSSSPPELCYRQLNSQVFLLHFTFLQDAHVLVLFNFNTSLMLLLVTFLNCQVLIFNSLTSNFGKSLYDNVS